ncbi:hypothetical protein VDG1235_3767 [Verrucomicrobiia bacterium DG1235]|nr:hypothetical protein VDG1235_3767 [Verrucomicrobiae bacterium DG1235]
MNLSSLKTESYMNTHNKAPAKSPHNPLAHLVKTPKTSVANKLIVGLSCFAAATSFTVSSMNAQVSESTVTEDEKLKISFNGAPGEHYATERAESLKPPVNWTPFHSRKADSNGLVEFSDSLEQTQQFYRIRPGSIYPPLVYASENTGADYPLPVLPELADLPVVEPLTDPFEWSDGSGRSIEFADWSRRRAEIKAEIENYEIGPKPDRPSDITASYTDGILTVNITENEETLTLTSEIILPTGDGPFPAIIGIGAGTGSLPSDIFSSRDIAQITFNFGQVMAHTQSRGNEPINRLYPDLTYMGAYAAWPWGISRLIDGLELVQEDLPIDLEHLAVSGCSFAGKMALFAGAFDERIALTIAQESGGGGAAAWRVSETLGNVETLGATNFQWFKTSMRSFAGSNVSKLPMDHHELMAMVAPRALLVLGNPDFVWLADESGYVSCRAAHRVWENFGIGDRFGFSIVDGHGHCALPNSQRPEVEAFVEKFLLDIEEADTDVTIHPYETVDYGRWTEWWGTEDPVFPGDE